MGYRGEGEEGDGLELLHPALYEFLVIFPNLQNWKKGDRKGRKEKDKREKKRERFAKTKYRFCQNNFTSFILI